MTHKALPTPSFVLASLDYDPETGLFVWKHVPGKKNPYEGKAAFAVSDGSGYLVGSLNGKMLRAHRVAWVFISGDWPVQEIDHINGDKSDNRAVNLREVSRTQNMHNRSITSANSSGFKGVTWNAQCGKWQAQGRQNGKNRYLGLFEKIEDAAAAYRDFSAVEHGEFSIFACDASNSRAELLA